MLGKEHNAGAVALGLLLAFACDSKTTNEVDQARDDDARDRDVDAGTGDSHTPDVTLPRGDDAGTAGSAGSSSGGLAGMGASAGSQGGAAASGGGSAGTPEPTAPSAPAGAMRPPDPEQVTTWDPEECHVPTVAEPSDPVLHELWTLARDYCLSIEEQGCLLVATSSRESLQACSVAEQVDACITEVLQSRQTQILPECDAAWRDSIECGTSATYVSCVDTIGGYPYGPIEACGAESDTLLACVEEYSAWTAVEGSYTTCQSGPGTTDGQCHVSCWTPDHLADLHCSGGEGLPLRCSCSINGHPFNEGSTIYGWVESIYVSDCEDAAKQAADGLCVNRVDCCFQYLYDETEVCTCGPHPAPIGFDSCEALADYAGGEVVDICPQWANAPGSCWPPGAPGCDF